MTNTLYTIPTLTNHPVVYWAIVGLVVWFAASAWTFFSAAEYMGLLLAVVTGFFFIAIAIPFVIWLVWHKNQDPDVMRRESISLRDWASCEFETWHGRRKATDAAVEIVIPIAATAFGLMALGSRKRRSALRALAVGEGFPSKPPPSAAPPSVPLPCCQGNLDLPTKLKIILGVHWDCRRDCRVGG